MGLNRYKGTWYKYFPKSFNFGISGDRAENVFWRALHLPEISYLKNVIILCRTNICIDSPIGHRTMLNRYWCWCLFFKISHPKLKYLFPVSFPWMSTTQ